ncbi:hypothetical protein BGW80DRAFT_383940 [Lactifluus volemus]|nr:hypothetical protein BGW80DRAFT_383940 [Lactifluus volemus]
MTTLPNPKMEEDQLLLLMEKSDDDDWWQVKPMGVSDVQGGLVQSAYVESDHQCVR